jgi:hypothetical protein
MSGLSQEISMQQSRAQTAGAVAGLGMETMSNSSAIDSKIKDIFG